MGDGARQCYGSNHAPWEHESHTTCINMQSFSEDCRRRDVELQPTQQKQEEWKPTMQQRQEQHSAPVRSTVVQVVLDER